MCPESSFQVVTKLYEVYQYCAAISKIEFVYIQEPAEKHTKTGGLKAP